jgi:nucleotide-binding universal stress UspA family protein
MFSRRPVFKRILVALDNREASQRAAEMAAGLAAVTGAHVALLHVIDVTRVYDAELGFAGEMLSSELRSAAEDLLDRYHAAFPSGIRVERLTRDGDPPAEIVKAADQWGADLIIVGSHGHGRLARLLLESTAESVLRGAHCPVLSVGYAPAPTPGNVNPSWGEEPAQVA